MKLKWQWFIGGKVMLWLSVILLIILVLGIVFTYIIDPITLIYMKPQRMDATKIKNISEEYVSSLGIKVDRPIVYRFVNYKPLAETKDTVTLGTFHEWNNTYYINISSRLYNMRSLEKIVIHETKHMIVEYMKDKKIVDLTKYTEEIAEGEDLHYDNIFRSSVYLLKYYQEKE